MFKVYTTNTCAYCTMVKKLFTMKEVQYQEVNIEDDIESQKRAIALSGGTSVPVVTKIENGEEKYICRGWNPSLLMQAIQI